MLTNFELGTGVKAVKAGNEFAQGWGLKLQIMQLPRFLVI